MELPDYDDLPVGPSGLRNAWFLFGKDDNVGMLNLQTPERVHAAAGLVRRGALFSLNVPFDFFSPPLLPTRTAARRTPEVVRLEHVTGFDDVLDNFYPQANSQWDSLAHNSHDGPEWYNGATEEDVSSGARLTIDHVARRGIAGRGVLLDLAAGFGVDPGGSHALTVADLEDVRTRAGVELQPGDVLMLNTGFGHWYGEQSAAVREALPSRLAAPGIEHSEDMARYLWNAHPAAIVSDTFAVEVWPPDFAQVSGPFGFMHKALLAGFGIPLGELWWLDELAEDCREDGVYECMVVAAPLNVPGGIGSTANAVAMK